MSSGSEPHSHLCGIRHQEELDGTLYAVEMMHVKTLIPRPACFSKFPFRLSFEVEMFITFIDLVNKTPRSERMKMTHFISHAPEVSFMPLIFFISKAEQTIKIFKKIVKTITTWFFFFFFRSIFLMKLFFSYLPNNKVGCRHLYNVYNLTNDMIIIIT